MFSQGHVSHEGGRKSLRVAVVGAGVAGLVAAYRLGEQGHSCDVYERWPGLGGQAATMDLGDNVMLEHYYHHIFMSDRHIVELSEEVGIGDEWEWHPSKVAIFADGQCNAFSTPKDLLRFKPLKFHSRLRMGLSVLLLQLRQKDVEPFEDMTAKEWVIRNMGREVYEKVWGPLLLAKFSNSADQISMAWLWSKLTIRRQIKGKQAKTEMLGYPKSSFNAIFSALQNRIESNGGSVFIDRPVAKFSINGKDFEITPGQPGSFRQGYDPRAFAPMNNEACSYNAVIATVPNEIFINMLDPGLARSIGEQYISRLKSIVYHTAVCLLLEVKHPLTEFYWTNVADPEIPFIGLIEHTNFISSERYGGKRFLYLANYKPAGDPLIEMDKEQLLDHYESGLKKVNPMYERDWIKKCWLFKEPAAQPVVTSGYQRKLPPLDTSVKGLVLANTTQIYPEDRGTNYAVRLGDQAVETLLAQNVG